MFLHTSAASSFLLLSSSLASTWSTSVFKIIQFDGATSPSNGIGQAEQICLVSALESVLRHFDEGIVNRDVLNSRCLKVGDISIVLAPLASLLCRYLAVGFFVYLVSDHHEGVC